MPWLLFSQARRRSCLAGRPFDELHSIIVEPGIPAISGWLNIHLPLSAEALARCGCDGLLVDLQHGAADSASVVPMLMAIEHGGTEPLVRVAANIPAKRTPMLDFGAYGIIAPIDTLCRRGPTGSSTPLICIGIGSGSPSGRWLAGAIRLAQSVFHLTIKPLLHAVLAFRNSDTLTSQTQSIPYGFLRAAANSVQVIDMMVGATGFEPVTPAV